MKIVALLSAGLLGVAAMLSPTTATAQQMEPREQVRQQQMGHTERRVVLTQRSHTVRRGNGWGHYRNRRVCRVTYRNHHRIRRCRTIRVRY